jgi:hypothetical protein
MKTDLDRKPEAAPALQLPTIHMNGTSKQELESQIEAADRALSLALDALNAAAPHARDYYPRHVMDFQAALEQHHGRVKMLKTVRRELGQIWEGICDGGHGHQG